MQTQKIAGSQIFGFEIIQLFTGQNSPYSKVFGFKVPTLNSGFKISGGMAKPGRFYFGFVHLRVNGKTNPVLTKRFRIRHESETISSSVNLVEKRTFISGQHLVSLSISFSEIRENLILDHYFVPNIQI